MFQLPCGAEVHNDPEVIYLHGGNIHSFDVDMAQDVEATEYLKVFPQKKVVGLLCICFAFQ